MKLTNESSYPLTVEGKSIPTGRTVEVDVDDPKKYRSDYRFSVEVDDTEEESDHEPESSKSDGETEQEEGDE